MGFRGGDLLSAHINPQMRDTHNCMSDKDLTWPLLRQRYSHQSWTRIRSILHPSARKQGKEKRLQPISDHEDRAPHPKPVRVCVWSKIHILLAKRGHFGWFSQLQRPVSDLVLKLRLELGLGWRSGQKQKLQKWLWNYKDGCARMCRQRQLHDST